MAGSAWVCPGSWRLPSLAPACLATPSALCMWLRASPAQLLPQWHKSNLDGSKLRSSERDYWGEHDQKDFVKIAFTLLGFSLKTLAVNTHT